MNLNEVKKDVNQITLILRCLLLKCVLSEKYRGAPHHRWMAQLASRLQLCRNVNTKVQQHDTETFCFSRMMHILIDI